MMAEVIEQKRMTMEVCACGKALYECKDRRHRRRIRIEVVPASTLTEALKERDEAWKCARERDERIDEQMARAEAAESRVTQLEEALRKAEPYLFNAPLEGALDVHAEIVTALNPEDGE